VRELCASYPILVVDSDHSERSLISQKLRSSGFDVTGVGALEEAGVLVGHDRYAAAVVRVWSSREGDHNGRDGLEALRLIGRHLPDCQPVVLLEPGADLEQCRRAVLLGACSFLEAGAGEAPDGLVERLGQAIGRYDVVRSESGRLSDRSIFEETGFAGQSRLMAEVLLQARRVAMISDAPVLIEGESGTGKQLLAEAIHRMDPKRSSGPFLVVNCAAIAGTLAESALFGHRRGAFTGATEERAGYFRAAKGGTVLLDEVGELDRPLQPKLLRVLQDGRVLPVGADREESVDVRVITSSNRPLVVLVAQDKFRLDLYQRLNVVYLELPPLRRRPEDIPLLFNYFVAKYGHYYQGEISGIDPRVYEVLGESVGAGNVRELENITRRVLAFKRSGERIELRDLPEAVLRAETSAEAETVTIQVVDAVRQALGSGRASLGKLLDECERAILTEALDEQGGGKSAAAKRLGITRRTLYNKLRKHNLE